MPPLLDPQAALEGRQQPGEMGVGEDPEVAVHRRAGDPRVAGQPRHGEHLAVKDRRHRQEAGEAGQIADQRFGLDFFLEIHLHVGLEGLAAVGSRPDHGQAAVAKHLGQVEIAAQLLRHERKHLPVGRPAGQQVGAGLLELAGARPQEHEPQAAVFDEPMHLVEQRRQPLDFIHHDRPAAGKRPQLVGKDRRVAEIRLIESLVQEVDPPGRGQDRLGPRALPRPAHPEEEKAPAPRGLQETVV